MQVCTFRSFILPFLIIFFPITIILLVIKNKVIDTLKASKKVLCDFLITYEKPEVQGFVKFLAN